MAKERDVNKEATDAEGALDFVTWLNIASPRGKGERRAEAVKAAAPKRQQTLDDYLFAKSPKESTDEALNKLSAEELTAMLGASDDGPGVDVTKGDAKKAYNLMMMKQGMEAGGKVDETGALYFDYGSVPRGLPHSSPEAKGKWERAQEEDDAGTLW